MSNVLVYVEQAAGKTKPAALGAIRFGQEVQKHSGGELHLVVLGSDAQKAAAEVAQFGAAKIWVADHPGLANPLAETYTTALTTAAKQCNAAVVGAGSTSISKDCFPRLSVRLDAGMASDISEVVDDKTFKRPMWAGNVIATVAVTTPVRLATVRATDFDAPEASSSSTPIEALDVNIDESQSKTRFVSRQEVKSERPDVTTASRVVSGGRGVKGAEGFALIEKLADALGAGVGASRAVCDAGWVPADYQIGQTGKVVAPDLYIAVGISGAIQHLAGMKGSKVIVAINKDPEAPIFQVADYGLVGDLFDAVPQLVQSIS